MTAIAVDLFAMFVLAGSVPAMHDLRRGTGPLIVPLLAFIVSACIFAAMGAYLVRDVTAFVTEHQP